VLVCGHVTKTRRELVTAACHVLLDLELLYIINLSAQLETVVYADKMNRITSRRKPVPGVSGSDIYEDVGKDAESQQPFISLNDS